MLNHKALASKVQSYEAFVTNVLQVECALDGKPVQLG